MPAPEPRPLRAAAARRGGGREAAQDAADLDLMLEAAREAGHIARRHFRTGPTAWEKSGGKGPVSEADLEIDRMLRRRLLGARPDYGWLSEETEDSPARLSAPAVFIVDPLDGTRAFLDGQNGFCHALAVARAGQVTAAVVHLPMLEQTYSARIGAGAFRDGLRLTCPPRASLTGARLLASGEQLAPMHWPGGLPAVARHFRPALAWRLCLVAEGAFDGAVTLRDAWHWDIAAGALIACEAGALVTDRFGAALRFNTRAPCSAGLIAGPEGVHSGLLAALGVGPGRDLADGPEAGPG